MASNPRNYHLVIQSDAEDLRTSAIQGDAANFRTSAVQGDAALLRMSALGVNIADISNDAADDFRVSTIQGDAVNHNISAKSLDAGTFLVSSIQGDAGLLRISTVGSTLSANQQISARLLGGTSFIGNVSAKNADASDLDVSAKSDDAALFRISAIAADADVLQVSAKSLDGGTLRTSAVQDGAAALNVSAKSDNAHLLRVSALPAPIDTYTTNGFSIGTTDTAVVSGVASQTIKVFSVVMSYTAAGATKWTGAGTALTQNVLLGASAGYTAQVPPPAFIVQTTSAGTDLELALSGTISATGFVTFWQD